MTNPYGDPDEDYLRVDSTKFGDDTDFNIRCSGCNKLLIEFATRPWQVRCPRCKAIRGMNARPR